MDAFVVVAHAIPSFIVAMLGYGLWKDTRP